MKTAWILCPVCGNKTRDRLREDTVLKNDPLYCSKCKQETSKKNPCQHKGTSHYESRSTISIQQNYYFL